MIPNPRNHRRRGFYGAENKACLSREVSASSSREYQDGDPFANSTAKCESFSSGASGSASSGHPLRRRDPSTPGHSGSSSRPDPTEQLAQVYRDLIGTPYTEDESEESFSSEVEEAGSSRVEEPVAPPSPDTEPFPEFEDVDPEEWYSKQGFHIDSSSCPPGAPWIQTRQEPTQAHNQAAHRQPCSFLAPDLGSPLASRGYRHFRRLQPSETRRIAQSSKFTYPESRREPEQSPSQSSVPFSSPSTFAEGKSCQTPPTRPAPVPESPTVVSRSGGPRSPRSSKRPRDYTQRPVCGTSTPLGSSRQGSESKNRHPGSGLGGTPQSSDRRRQLRVVSSPASPYPAYRFDTHRRIYDPLNFVPFDPSSSHVDLSGDRSPEPSGNEKSRKSSAKSGTFSLARTLRKGSSDSSRTVVPSSESKRKNKFKRTGSSGLASSIKKLFHPGSRKSSVDATIDDAGVLGAADVSSSDASTKSKHKQIDDCPSRHHHHPVPGTQEHRQPAEPQATHWASASPACFLKAGEKRVNPFQNRRFPALTCPESYPRGELPEFHFPQQAQTVDILNSETVSDEPGPTVKITGSEESLSTQVYSPGDHLSVSQNFHPANMDPSRASRFLDPSSAVATITRQKAEAIRLAKEQAAAVKEMCRRAKTDVPPYEFEELIGKGAYGRVYKGRQLPSRNLVAIKVMEIDSTDYKINRDMKDESIKDFIHEIKVMNQAKEAGAKNINMLIEAISIHSQLWVVCEYCPGGSVKTLMRATGDKLEEKFIIPIARELAVGLKAIHDAGIIHRDVKAANILIHEEGRLQICDFGVAGILQSKLDKRSTWIGTPHWMPPEMFSNRGGEAHKYGSELDVWAYGCTLFECATGNPPNAGLRERIQIGRQLTRVTPKLEGEEFSQGLKDLVSYSLNSDPTTRPTMGNILEHPYIANSEETYPTSSLSELVRIYYQWTQCGGQRISLFNPGGAAAAEFPGDNSELDEDWNFSTTDGFERRFSIIDLDQVTATLAELEGQTPSTAQPEYKPLEDTRSVEMTPLERANFDERVKRGAAAMEGLFDEDKPTYKYETKNDFVPIEQKPGYSDLPLRTVTDRSSVTSTFIDINLGSFDSSHYAAGSASNTPFQLADADTIRANRSSLRSNRNSSEERSRPRSESEDSFYQPPSGPRPPTMDWKFPTMMQPAEDDEEPKGTETYTQTERRATRDWKFPVMTPDVDDSQHTPTDDAISETIRPSHAQQPPTTSFSHGSNKSSVDSTGESRPSTATSTVSTTSEYDPFRFDRPPTPPTRSSSLHRTVYDTVAANLAKSGYSDESSVLEGPGPDHEEPQPVWQEKDPSAVSYSQPFPPIISSKPEESTSTSLVTTAPSVTLQTTLVESREASSSTNKNNGPAFIFPDVQPPSAESLIAGADDSVVAAELDRLLGDFNEALNVTAEAVKATNVMPRGRRTRNVSVSQPE